MLCGVYCVAIEYVEYMYPHLNTLSHITTHSLTQPHTQDRTPYVEVLEEEMTSLASQRGFAFNDLRSSHHTEELALCDEAARVTLGTLSTAGGDVHAAHAAAEAAFGEAESALVGRVLPVVLDEFGRDENVGARQATKKRYVHIVLGVCMVCCISIVVHEWCMSGA